MPRTTATKPARAARSVRCQRCAAAKFRTPRDLALHIISKHGHVRLHAAAAAAAAVRADDTRSVTQSSPLLTQCRLAELDAMLRDGLPQPDAAPAEASRAAPSQPEVSVSARREPPRKRPYRAVAYSESSSTSDSSQRRPSTRPRRQREELHELSKPRRMRRKVRRKPVEGESVGPQAADVVVRRCRTGQMSLVPSVAQTPVTLNFANGLF